MDVNVVNVPVRAQTDNYLPLINLTLSEEYIRQSDFSKEKYKTITLDVMDSVLVSGDAKTMNNVASVVAKWNKKECEWVGYLLNWVKTLEDAQELLVCKNGSAIEVVVVVEDATRDEVLDYNEFLFEVRSKYDEVHDFMVLDEELKSALPAMYTQVDCIYKRGEQGAV